MVCLWFWAIKPARTEPKPQEPGSSPESQLQQGAFITLYLSIGFALLMLMIVFSFRKAILMYFVEYLYSFGRLEQTGSHVGASVKRKASFKS